MNGRPSVQPASRTLKPGSGPAERFSAANEWSAARPSPLDRDRWWGAPAALDVSGARPGSWGQPVNWGLASEAPQRVNARRSVFDGVPLDFANSTFA
jgi:hypothetical protein